jgi:hypothetical protein
MDIRRRRILKLASGAFASCAMLGHAGAASRETSLESILRNWYRLVLELVRHTPTYSPPVASRAFAYLGVIAYEAAAWGSDALLTLAGQLNGLEPLPGARLGGSLDRGVVLNAALAKAVGNFFANTGPTGQRVLQRFTERTREKVTRGVSGDVVTGSEALGLAIAEHVIAWSQVDGGAVIENMGFPYEYELKAGPAHWIPTSQIGQQQLPLLPEWGENRTFALKDGAACPLPPPPAYSEDPSSAFYREALEVYQTATNLTPEQKLIARFWSDDPMLSPTPPGHWISIALDILDRKDAGLDESADVLARLGIALSDAFIVCWHSKFEFDLLRPVTYIRRLIDPRWEPLLITPPFPEYPSGHSTQSGAAAAVLSSMFGENFSFEDATHKREGMAPRSFRGFWEAADEAGISRLYGGIHFRSAIDRGLDQGRCVGAAVIALRTRA